MSSKDSNYYRRRAAAERALALAAGRDNVRAIHEEFARRYDALADAGDFGSAASQPDSEAA